MSFEVIESNPIPRARIRVIGIGGGGGNAVNTMIENGIVGVDFAVINTDAQDLERSLSHTRFQLGMHSTQGLGTGGNPDLGRDSAVEDKEALRELIIGCDMVFLTAGMGGGTGTGVTPVLAQLAREEGVLTVGVVTRPFFFEGNKRKKISDAGIEELRQCVDTLITIPNQRLISLGDKNTTLKDSFNQANQVLFHAIRGVSDLINSHGLVNVDFADIQTIMKSKGIGLMGMGWAQGKRAIIEAAQVAVTSPLLDDISIVGAKHILVNIRGNSTMRINEMSEASRLIAEEAHPDAHIILGLVMDDEMGDAVQVTVIATDFEENRQSNQVSPVRKIVNGVEGNPVNDRRPTNKPPLVSGLDDLWMGEYDLPTFRKR